MSPAAVAGGPCPTKRWRERERKRWCNSKRRRWREPPGRGGGDGGGGGPGGQMEKVENAYGREVGGEEEKGKSEEGGGQKRGISAARATVCSTVRPTAR